MKISKILGDAAVTAGCCVGVGLLSGKETQVFFRSDGEIALFAAVFAAVNIAVRNYCISHSCNGVVKLSANCFKKFSPIMSTALIFCSFVCLITALAGAEQCLSQIYYVGRVPLYSVCCAALGALILVKGMKALKIANYLSFLLAAVFIIIVFCKKNGGNGVSSEGTEALMPVSYALFSVTMSLGVTCKLAVENSKKENVLCCVISAAVVAAILYAVKAAGDPASDLPMISNLGGWEKAAASLALTLAAVTGTVANAQPLSEELKDVIPDDVLRCAFIFTAAIAFSVFGFDFALRYGYVAVSLIGLTLFAAVCAQYFIKSAETYKKGKKKRREKQVPRRVKKRS